MKQTLVLDIEVYSNYFLAQFKSIDTGKVRSFEMFDGCDFDRQTVNSILKSHRIVTFNGLNFDMPILTLALKKFTCEQLKQAADLIILGEKKSWEIERFYDFRTLPCDHIDLIEVAPGVAIGLKLYGARLHSKKLQDLPIDPAASITPEQRQLLREYCVNDLDTTIDLWKVVKDRVDLREAMGKQYGIELRSKSDAQIAETVIANMVQGITGVKPTRPVKQVGRVYKYTAPEFLKFKTAKLQAVLKEVCESDFVIGEKGNPVEPPALKSRVVEIGSSKYRLGIGGLHSSEESQAHFAGSDQTILDVDVASYYPSIILQCGLFPEHMGASFLQVYKQIVDSRLAAKKEQQRLSKRIKELKKELSDAIAKEKLSQTR